MSPAPEWLNAFPCANQENREKLNNKTGKVITSDHRWWVILATTYDHFFTRLHFLRVQGVLIALYGDTWLARQALLSFSSLISTVLGQEAGGSVDFAPRSAGA